MEGFFGESTKKSVTGGRRGPKPLDGLSRMQKVFRMRLPAIVLDAAKKSGDNISEQVRNFLIQKYADPSIAELLLKAGEESLERGLKAKFKAEDKAAKKSGYIEMLRVLRQTTYERKINDISQEDAYFRALEKAGKRTCPTCKMPFNYTCAVGKCKPNEYKQFLSVWAVSASTDNLKSEDRVNSTGN